MGLLLDIQQALLDPASDIGPILLKFRYLASKLDSDLLQDWVKYETEGYPAGAEVPEYRNASVHYKGTFTNGVYTINDAAIPEATIKKEAGEHWLHFPIKDSIAVIDKLVGTENTESGTKMGIAVANLTPLLNGKVYEGMGAISLTATFAGSPFTHIHNMVRAKMLDLSLALEKEVPIASTITIGSSVGEIDPAQAGRMTQITQYVVYGNQTNISNTATNGGSIQVHVATGDQTSLVQFLTAHGVPHQEATELATIASEEGPEDQERPIGQRAKAWLEKAVGGTWGVTKEVGTQLLIEALKGYYGLGS